MKPKDTDLIGAWRRDVYGVLSFAYHRPPSPEDMDKMDLLGNMIHTNGSQNTSISLTMCVQFAKKENSKILVQDFNDLFMVPAGSYVTPYESVYVDGYTNNNKPMTFGKATRQVQSFYTRIGLDISQNYTELPDYIGLELACMEYLCTREVELTSSNRKTEAQSTLRIERQFLTEHLSIWVPALCEKIIKYASSEYYRALARATDEFIRSEEALICKKGKSRLL